MGRGKFEEDAGRGQEGDFIARAQSGEALARVGWVPPNPEGKTVTLRLYKYLIKLRIIKKKRLRINIIAL